MTVETIRSTKNSSTAREKDKFFGYVGEAEPVEGMNIIIIPKQDVKFSEPPPLKTKKRRTRDKQRPPSVSMTRNSRSLKIQMIANNGSFTSAKVLQLAFFPQFMKWSIMRKKDIRLPTLRGMRRSLNTLSMRPCITS